MAEVSSNVVGYQNQKIASEVRAMGTPTFIPVSGTTADVTIGDIKQVGGYPGMYTLTTYGSNVNMEHEYWYFSEDIVADMDDTLPGWYEVIDDEPDFEKGVQNAVPIPYGTGIVMSSVDDDIEESFAGQVYDKELEFSIPSEVRKMTGNVLPRRTAMSEIKQIGGYPGMFTLTTYGNNVNMEHEYWYFSEDVVADMDDTKPGWYEVIDDEPDFEAGPSTKVFDPSEGFVVSSVDDSITLRFPKAIADK